MTDKKLFSYKYPHPAVAVDIGIFTLQDEQLQVLLIERARDPYKGSWALPGGFVRMDEDLAAAAARELEEETGVVGTYLEQVAAFGHPHRDPRERVISIAFYAIIPSDTLQLQSGTDAAAARWWHVDQLPKVAFDHLESAASGRQLAVLTGHVASIQWAVYSPDGRRIVTASQDKTARLWDAQSGAQLALLSGHDASLTSVAFSPDGIHIAPASADKTARIWDIRTGEQRAVLSGHGGAVESVAYSPDGAHVVTASVDRTVRIWDSHDGRQLSLLQGHDDVVYMAAYSPDNKYVVSASQDKTAIVHDASVPADIGGQVAWYEAAESDPLTGVDRVELGLGPDPQIRAPSAAETDCDQAAAAWYDPDRAAAGVVLESINIEAAAAALLPRSNVTRAISVRTHMVGTTQRGSSAIEL